jgi:hypothetical protein
MIILETQGFRIKELGHNKKEGHEPDMDTT